MKIAFISFEYPPDAAYGGIATYVHQAARMMHSRGHHVEIFTSSPHRTSVTTEDGLVVHRIQEDDYEAFPSRIGGVFARRHRDVRFEVLEGPEYAADAREAVALVPDIPLVVKLHTPTFLTVQGTYDGLPVLNRMRLRMLQHKIRRNIGALMNGRELCWRYLLNYDVERERLHALEADEIAAPSRSIAAIVKEAWHLPAEKVAHYPYPYVPPEALLQIPTGTRSGTVTFIGRLEVRKGVLDLARAVPLILRRNPQVRIRFVGSSEHAPDPRIEMRDHLERVLRLHRSSIEFVGRVAPNDIPQIHAETDVCVFPSIWENFPNVCLEAMAAGRAIVGSRAGGMADMLNTDAVGRLVAPGSPSGIAGGVNELLGDPALRDEIGEAARRRLLREYNADRIGALQEESYRRAIARRRRLGPRASVAAGPARTQLGDVHALEVDTS